VGTGFHPELTGHENIFMNGAILGMTKQEIKSKLDEIIDFSGVENFIDTPVKRYSSGMSVRLAFAVAAHLEPEILVIDEVLAVGDISFQRKCLGKMGEVARQGRTVLFVSHNLVSVQSLCTRAILLQNGQKYHEGDVSGIINHYLADSHVGGEGKYVGPKSSNGKSVWIASARVLVNGKVAKHVLSGQNVQFVFDYYAVSEGLPFAMFIGIYDNLGNKILHLGTPYGENKVFFTQKKGQIKLTIQKFPLSSGRYTINFSLHLNNYPHDRVKNAMTMLVARGDFYGNGQLPPEKEAKFLVEQNWVLNE